MSRRPTLAVFKFASCDGCQLSLLDCEDELLAVADRLHIAYFLEATSHIEPGPYDVALVEGSITTPHDAERIRQVRAQSKYLITIGACATAGGIQALRNWADTPEYLAAVYARPDYIQTLSTSTPIADQPRSYAGQIAPQPACVTGPRHGVPCATITQTVPRRLQSRQTAWTGVRGRRPANSEPTTSSNWCRLIGQPRSSKSTFT